MEIPAWVSALFATIDAKDADAFVEPLTEDCEFVFGNAPPVAGRAAVRDAVAGFFDSVRGLEHRLDGAWVHPDAVICRGKVTYTRHDGSELAVPFADVFDMEGTRIKRYAIYIDASQLYAV